MIAAANRSWLSFIISIRLVRLLHKAANPPSAVPRQCVQTAATSRAFRVHGQTAAIGSFAKRLEWPKWGREAAFRASAVL